MKPLLLLVAVALGLATVVSVVSAGPEAIECWFVEDAGGGGLSKKPATLLLRHGPRGPPPRPDLDPKLYFKVDDPAGMLLAAFRRYPAGASAPHCEMSRFIPFPASAKWARSLSPQQNCPRALDGDWLLVSVSSTLFSLSGLLRPQREPQRELVFITMATEAPRVSLTPAPIVWAAPGEAPPELLCLASHFFPAEGLEVKWELRGGPGGSSRKVEGKTWLSTIRHHSDGSVSQSGHLQLPPATAKQHGVHYVCRVHHSSLPASGRSADVTLEVAGFSGPSIEDGIGLFLSAFLLLGLLKVLGWLVAAYWTIPEVSKEKVAAASLTIPRNSKKSQ
ncbi:tapasin isoform X3 [Mus caroli]|uniref:Tapasin isoform X3 n=1 Tax=Mus caroli TaxID=10089 RepID=A0A6P7QD71_MUSCR|nr:tapasin isoform X3 [Mus caroli]